MRVLCWLRLHPNSVRGFLGGGERVWYCQSCGTTRRRR